MSLSITSDAPFLAALFGAHRCVSEVHGGQNRSLSLFLYFIVCSSIFFRVGSTMRRLTHHRLRPPIERRALRCSMSPDTITLRPRSSPVRCREAEFNPQFLRSGLAVVGIYKV